MRARRAVLSQLLHHEADLLVVQAVGLLEGAGGQLDKAPLRQAVQELEERAREGQRKTPRSEHFERFKFWLGLPNTYYHDLEQ